MDSQITDKPMRLFGWMADGGPCGHYRMVMPLRQLRLRGHDLAYGQKIPEEWQDAPLIIGQRVCMPGPSRTWQKWARSGKYRLIFEVDDNLFDVHHTNSAAWQFFQQRHIQANLAVNIAAADLVTVTTPDLAEAVSKYNPNVKVLPNCIDESVLSIPRPARAPGAPPVLGWQGSTTHEMDFAEITRPLGRLLRQNPTWRMLFVGVAHPKGLPATQLDLLGWTTDYDQHYRQVSTMDIGLAPLRPHPFNRSKSWLRLLEYAALGIPYVASDMPAYRAFTQHNGFLVMTEHMWISRIRDLVNDPELAQEMGQRGRKLAADWTIQKRAVDWETTYRTLLG